VGCGSGQQTLPLARQGANVLAVDLSEDMLRLARAKLLASGATGQASFVRGIAEQLPLASESCGGAVICGSLHHFTDPPRALQEAGRVLEPQARFFLLEPHASPVRFLFDWSMRLWTLWEEEARDEPLFDAVQFRHWLAAAGIDHRIGYSTYLPPHLFYWIRGAAGAFLLRASDRVLSGIPGLRRLAGVITAEGTKARVREPELTEAGASSPCPAAP
jgi:SAM-dependent methyltransferase